AATTKTVRQSAYRIQVKYLDYEHPTNPWSAAPVTRCSGPCLAAGPPCGEETIMRGSRHRRPFVILLGALLCSDAAGAGRATTSEEGSSILFFAKVVADGPQDTLIEITNTSNMLVLARCVYVNGFGACSATATPCRTDADCPMAQPPQTCVGRWRTVDFNIVL